MLGRGEFRTGRAQRGDRAAAELVVEARGALQPAELARLEKIIPTSISPFDDPEPYLKQAEQFIQEQIARREASYGTGPAGSDKRGPSAASNYGFSAE